MEKGVRNMSPATSIRDDIATCAGSYKGNRKGLLAAAARNVKGVSHRMMRALFYNEVDANHLAAQAVARQAAIIAGRREAAALAAQYETIAGGLIAKDQNFHSADIAALLHAARVLRDVDCA